MRTTIRLDDALLRRAKAHAAVAAELPTFRGRGVQPGVDLDDNAGLLDLM